MADQQVTMADIDALDDPKPEVEDQYEDEDADTNAIEVVEALDEKEVTKQLAKRLPPEARVTFNDVVHDPDSFWRIAKAMCVGQPADRVAKTFQSMIVGISLGLSPATAATGINIINGKLTLSCHLIKGVLDEAGWDVIIEDSDPLGEWCRVTAKKDGKSPVSFKYTIDMAKQQGLIRDKGPWKTNPWDMLYARAVSIVGRRAEGGRLAGFYAPEEFGKKSPESRGSRERLG